MRLAIALVLVAGCGQRMAAMVDIDGGAAPDGGAYATIGALHSAAMAPTCSLNNGVCHNSKEYPDFHTVSNLIDAVNQPCNLNAAKHSDVHDACEPSGDRLVLPSLGVDAEIATVVVSPPDADSASLTSAVVTLGAPLAASAGAGASDLAVKRGSSSFTLGAAGVIATVADARTVTLDLTNADPAAKTFLDDRVYPWQPSMVRVADVNGNGTLGHGMGMALVVPGQPMQSYLLLRLIDNTQGDLMPRQCREWDQQATRALGCWIRGLKMAADGTVANANDPIDYARCDFDPGTRGRCAQNKPVAPKGSFAAAADVFTRSCGGEGCHSGAMPAGSLDLSAGRAWGSLVGAQATEVTGMLRVKAGDPDASYLYCKIDPSCTQRAFAQMPYQAGTLPQADRDAIRDWIVMGAAAN